MAGKDSRPTSPGKSKYYSKAVKIKRIVDQQQRHFLVFEECGSGLNEDRKKLQKLLLDKSITRIVVEHKDRLTRFGFNYIKKLWHGEIVVINEVLEDEKDLMQDFVSLVTSFTARLYGRRRSKRQTEKLIAKLSQDHDELQSV